MPFIALAHVGIPPRAVLLPDGMCFINQLREVRLWIYSHHRSLPQTSEFYGLFSREVRTTYGWFRKSARSIFTVTFAPSVTVSGSPRSSCCRANSGSAYSTCASAGQQNKR